LENLQGLIVKKLSDYLNESEFAAENPVTGDVFAINIREECLVESVVLEHAEDGVVIAADDRMLEIFESYGITVEDVCMECGLTECECSHVHEDETDEHLDEFAAGMLARAALPFAAGAAMGAMADNDTNEARDPGEYDEEGDMAKTELHTMIRAARKLIGMLDNDANMPEWTQKKITKATDYVDTAADYISSQKERGVMEQGVEESKYPWLDAAKPPKQPDAPRLVRDRKTGKEYDPHDEFAKAMNSPEVRAQMKRMSQRESVAEGPEETSPVARAVLHRIMMAHPGVLAQHGPERVMSAVDELADRVNIGPDDEIGTSDVSGWVRDVIRMLSELPDEPMSDVDALDEAEKKGLYYNVNKRKQAGTSRDKNHPKAPTAQAWKDAAKTAKTEGYEIDEAEYQGRKVELNKPSANTDGASKSKVYVKDPQTGNVKKVTFGDPDMRIRKSNPGARKNFRARHNCANPGPKTKARYWSCRAW
jgi:hypothetical protein